MKTLLLIILLSAAFLSNAQKGLDEMIAAEKAFAAHSVSNNTIDAFLKFMDTSAIMFKNGEPYKAYESWVKREKRLGVLNWRPRYAEIAASGDFGWTAGPWTFQPNTVNDSVVAHGYFFTIWKKNSAGEWKFIFDVGTDAGPMMKETDVVKLEKGKSKSTEESLRDAEEKFIKYSHTDIVKAFKELASEQIILTRENYVLLYKSSSWKHPPASAQPTTGSVVHGIGIAPSGDLGFAYGTVTLNGKKEAYLRIWRHELSGWKIALQMVRL